MDRMNVVVYIVFILILTIKNFNAWMFFDTKDHGRLQSHEPQQLQEDYLQYASEILDGLNKSIDPCEDFYEYACGGWKSKQKMNDRDMFRSFFVEQKNDVEEKIRRILETSESGNRSALRKAQDMYQHCLNLTEDEGIESILKSLKVHEGWPLIETKEWDLNHTDLNQIENLLTRLARIRQQGQTGSLFLVKVSSDLKNNSNQVITFSQPSASELYSAGYLSEENKNRKIANIVKLAQRLNPSVNEENAIKDGNDIFELNNAIVNCLTLIDDSDLSKYYTKLTVGKFISLTQINWLHFLNVLFDSIKTIELNDEIVILTIDYFLKLSPLLLQHRFTPRTFINFELTKEISFQHKLTLMEPTAALYSSISSLTPHCLPTQEKPFPGPQPVTHPRATTCLMIIETCFDNTLSWKYGELYLNRKKDVKEARGIARNIFDVFRERLNQLDWLDNKSKKMALDKLSSMSDYYLYPQWDTNQQLVNRFYNDFSLANNFINDIISYQKFITNKRLLKLVTSSRYLNGWSLSPLKVDAVYMAEENAVHILAGIMQPPIYSAGRLKVMNYGSLGTIIGHEIIHGFDLIGIQFDKNGNLNKWITTKSKNSYLEKNRCFVDQYSKYQLTSADLPGSEGFKVNGFDTLNENIADNAGLRNAYWAYKRWSEKNRPEILPESLQNFSTDQVFFLSFAHTWCQKYGTSANWEETLGRDSHSPPKYRVIGTVSNFNEFSRAFKCNRSNTNMDRKICELW